MLDDNQKHDAALRRLTKLLGELIAQVEAMVDQYERFNANVPDCEPFDPEAWRIMLAEARQYESMLRKGHPVSLLKLQTWLVGNFATMAEETKRREALARRILPARAESQHEAGNGHGIGQHLGVNGHSRKGGTAGDSKESSHGRPA